MADDPADQTLTGGQPWQDLGSPELVAHPVAQAQPILLDPQTARAVRALCWALCVTTWLFTIAAAVALAGLFVGVVAGPVTGP
jgi:hypothetical protein